MIGPVTVDTLLTELLDAVRDEVDATRAVARATAAQKKARERVTMAHAAAKNAIKREIGLKFEMPKP